MSSTASLYDPSGFLELADQLLGDGRYAEKGRSRTVVGRAYYAAFLMVKKKLESLGCSFEDIHRIHEQVIVSANEKNSAVGNKLETLRRYRVDADYEMGAQINVSTAGKCVSLSRKVMHSLNQFR